MGYDPLEKIAYEAADRAVRKAVEEGLLLDVAIGSLIGDGAIPLRGRERRRAPCRGCRIDPAQPLEAGNIMATTDDAIGTLSQGEVREWCSELIELPDGRCQRAQAMRQAARECKERHPGDTAGFFKCYAPDFSAITKGS